MDDDWDLQAVVRSCATTSTSSSTTTPPPLPPPPHHQTKTPTPSYTLNLQSFSSNFQHQLIKDNNLICFQDLFEPKKDKDIEIEGLHDLRKPFFLQTSKPQPISPQTVLGCFQDPSSQPQPQQQQTSSNFVSKKRDCSNNPRPKKRKNQMKKVCKIPAEGLSSDMWSWRKYGQKPIKGSPYPRGYYKCSTLKGCLARKQVERDRSSPNMLIVTYTGEHSHPMPTHRNSLAGSIRQKPVNTVDDPNKPSIPSLDSPTATDSPEAEKTAGEEDDDDFDISNMQLDDEFFSGLENELVSIGSVTGQSPARNNFPATTQFPWLWNNVTTTTAGSG